MGIFFGGVLYGRRGRGGDDGGVTPVFAGDIVGVHGDVFGVVCE